MRTHDLRQLFSWFAFALLGAAIVAASRGAAAAKSVEIPAKPARLSPADLIYIYADKDAFVRSWQPDANFGGDYYLNISLDPRDPPAREEAMLIHFDLAGLPANATIDAATLELYQVGATGVTPVTISLYSVLDAWSESAVTYNAFPRINPNWPLACSIDATVNEYKGCDLTTLAQSWRNNPTTNHGVFLRGPASALFLRAFESRNKNEHRPRLAVRYHLPTATPTTTPTATLTRPPTPTFTRTPIPTTTRPPTPTFTRTPIPTATRTPTPTFTRTPIPTATRTPTPTFTRTPLPIATRTPTTTLLPTVVVTLCPVADAYVDSAHPDSNYGEAASLKAGLATGVEPYTHRIFLSYDLSFLPAGSAILGAQLEMTMRNADGPSPVTIAAHPVLDPWREQLVTWRNQPGAQPAPVASTPVGSGVPSTVVWDVRQIVQDWHDGRLVNWGLALTGPETGDRWRRQFDSREGLNCPALRLVVRPNGFMPTPTPTSVWTPTPTPTSQCAAPDQAGASFAQASALSAGTATDEYICPSGDSDWWKFPVTQGQEIWAFLYNMPQAPPADYDLTLVNPTGGGVGSSTLWGADRNEVIHHAATSSGDYRLLVQGKGVADWSGRDPYTVLVKLCGAPDEAGGDFADARLITYGVKELGTNISYQGYLCPEYDEDWYRFEMPNAGTVDLKITLTDLPADYELALYNPSGQQAGASLNHGLSSETIQTTIQNVRPGGWRVRVFAKQAGVVAPMTSYRLQVELGGMARDITIDGWEVTQGLQDLASTVPLVARKPTYVRVYGRQANGYNSPAVQAQLFGWRAGAPLPGSPLAPLNGAIPLAQSPAVNFDRGQATTGWLFRLPDSWITAGEVTLRVVADPKNQIVDLNRPNNQREGIFTFTAKAPACLMFVPIHTTAQIRPSTRDPNFGRMIDLFKRLWPVADVWMFEHNDYLETVPGVPYLLPYSANAIVYDLWHLDLWTDDPDQCDDIGAWTQYVGMVHPATPNPGMNGNASTFTGHAWVVLPPHDANPPTIWTWPRAGSTLAHELSHNYGLQHINCACDPEDVPEDTDPSYPYSPCYISHEGRQYHYGFDSNTRQPIMSMWASDYMSYGCDRWVSNWTYEKMFAAITTRPAASITDKAEAAAGEDLTLAAAAVLVSGVVTPSLDQAFLDYTWVMPAGTLGASSAHQWRTLAAPIASTEGAGAERASIHIQLLNAGGTVLADRAVTLAANHPQPDQPRTYNFAAAFPAPAGEVAQLALLDGVTMLASKQTGLHSPSVTLLRPLAGETIAGPMTVAWAGLDPDPADRLLYIVQYSADGGVSWTAIATNAAAPSGAVTMTIQLESLAGIAGSSNARVRVVASDGYHTAFSTSQPFTVADSPPQASILWPSPGAVLPPGEPLLLTGAAVDTEDGSLPANSLRWMLDGASVAAGSEVWHEGLAPGPHLATLVARDAAGQEDTAEAGFQIETLRVPGGPAPALDGYCDDPAYQDARTLVLAPYADGTRATIRLLRVRPEGIASAGSLWACFSDLQGEGNAGFLIDPGGEGGTVAGADHFGFFVTDDGLLHQVAGDGQGGFAARDPAGMAGLASPAGAAWSAELWVDLARIGVCSNQIRLAVGHWLPASTSSWPYLTVTTQPDTWALTDLAATACQMYMPLVAR